MRNGAPVPGLLAQIAGVLRKELLTEWRQRGRVSGIFWFALAVVLMVSFATPESALLPRIAGGTLWVGLLLASTRSLDQSYAVEHEHGALEGLVLWPVDPIAIYYGKAIANTVLLLLVSLALLPLLVAVFDAEVKGDPLELLGTIALGCAALAAPGTLYGLVTSQARGSSVLLPLLLFPLVVPAVLAAANATTRVLEGDPMNQVGGWMTVLLAFDAVHWSLSGLLYGRILED
jgi:heme exporter protein B